MRVCVCVGVCVCVCVCAYVFSDGRRVFGEIEQRRFEFVQVVRPLLQLLRAEARGERRLVLQQTPVLPHM